MPAGLRHVLGSDRIANGYRQRPIQTRFMGRGFSLSSPLDVSTATVLTSTKQIFGSTRTRESCVAARMARRSSRGTLKAAIYFVESPLPANHDDFMPKGKKALSSDEVKLIELWIGAGASETLAKDAIKDAPADSRASSCCRSNFSGSRSSCCPQMRSAIAPAVAELQKRFPNILDYESRGSADLRLNASILGTRFGDNDLADFAAVAEHITVADFSRTGHHRPFCGHNRGDETAARPSAHEHRDY